MKKRSLLLWMTFLITLGSGVVNIISVIGPSLPKRHSLLREVFPLEFLHISRFLTLLIGFALVISSINIYKRKKRAFQLVLLLSVLSVIFHLTKGLDYEEALLSLLLIVALLVTRKRFVVKSSIPDWRLGILRFVIASFITLGYGILGFWLLDQRQFGIDFNFIDSVRKTLGLLFMSSSTYLVPHTHYARWFLDSIYLISMTAIAYSFYAIFRPAIYRFRTLPMERAFAAEVLTKHGKSSLEFFKLWSDKSYFFSPSQKSFLAYRVGGSFALVLADPVGPEEEIQGIIHGFMDHCAEHDWRLAFHQTLPDFLPVYKELGFKKLKIGEEGIVDLNEFSVQGKRMKHLRHYTNQFEKAGVQVLYYEPPISDEVLSQVKEVSDEWLKVPGRKERGFTQGIYSKHYIQSTPLFTATDQDGKVLAFVNVIPSYCPGETTIDLMRHRVDAPPGIMDYLFIQIFSYQKQKGFTRFNLGLAPMTGFQEKEEASPEERAVHYFLQRLNFVFSYSGLFQYKKKFATSWEPRYEIYRNVFDLPRLAIALNQVSSAKVHEYSHEE